MAEVFSNLSKCSPSWKEQINYFLWKIIEMGKQRKRLSFEGIYKH